MAEHTRRNPVLDGALRSYCVEALKFWKSAYPTEESVPRETVPKVTIEQDGTSFATENIFNFLHLQVDRMAKDPVLVRARAAVEQAMRADNQIARHLDTSVGTSGWSWPVDVDGCLRMFLAWLLNGQKTLEFDEPRFVATYEAMEDYFYSDSVRFRAVAPLPEFMMDVDRLDLEPNFRIIRLDIQEREQAMALALRFPTPAPMHDVSYGWEPFALELILELPKIFGRDQGSAATPAPGQLVDEPCESALSALRLFKSGMVRCPMVRLKLAGWSPFGGTLVHGLRVGPVFGTYTLSPSETEQFRAFWRQYRRDRERKRPRIVLGLRRFNFAYERMRLEDRLIDYMIALEALLTKRNDRGPLGYRLALRGSRLLAEETAARTSVFNWLSLAYRLRNRIVHGTDLPSITVDGKLVAFADFVGRVEGYVRETIREMLRRTESVDEIIGLLDRDIITGS